MRVDEGNSAGNPVAAATVLSGAVAPLVSGFRCVPINPVILGAGTFTIGGYANGTSESSAGRRRCSMQDLAALYGVPTEVFNQAVQRNSDRFPSDFTQQAQRSARRARRNAQVVLPERS
jgi:hypothetical protein